MKLDTSTVGNSLLRLRKNRDLTQAAAATAAAISRSHLAAIESGQSSNLELGTLLKLLEVYGAELHFEPRTPRRTLNQILREAEKARDL